MRRRLALSGLLSCVLLAAGCGTDSSGRSPDRGAAGKGESSAPGFTDFRTSMPDAMVASHKDGPLEYPMAPPVGGPHNPKWQNCEGDVYAERIANERAVHSLEHGAVWITYRPDLKPSEVDALAKRVDGVPFMLMSPYPDLDTAVSLQAWGYQLKVSSAADERIDDFIEDYRVSASREPGAPCSGGVTRTGTVGAAS